MQSDEPTEEELEIYRAAAKAYRDHCRKDSTIGPCYAAARRAVQTLRPDLTKEQAQALTIRAINWVSVNHTKWFLGDLWRKA
jgi:hypothetical protein